MNSINEENISNYLAVFIEKNGIEIREVAKAINCSVLTLQRIIAQKTYPTPNLIMQVGILVSIGLKPYRKLSNAEKGKISEKIGALGGGILGFGTITSAIGAAGTVTGLSAAGISSGLATIGAAVGGGMAAEITTVAFIPIIVGGIGYALIKRVKSLISNNKLNNEEIEPHWEYIKG